MSDTPDAVTLADVLRWAADQGAFGRQLITNADEARRVKCVVQVVIDRVNAAPRDLFANGETEPILLHATDSPEVLSEVRERCGNPGQQLMLKTLVDMRLALDEAQNLGVDLERGLSAPLPRIFDLRYYCNDFEGGPIVPPSWALDLSPE